MRYPHIAQRIFNTPLLIHPQKLDAIIAGIGSRILGTQVDPANVQTPNAPAPGMFSTQKGVQADRGYRVIDGVAVLNIAGALVHRSQFLAADSTFLLGYNDISMDLEDAMANPDVHAVLQVYDSPGGEVQGAFEYAQRVLDLRGKKPMRAIADGMAASAAYLGGSAADELTVTPTGYAGSIGVVMRHVDFSRALANDGISVEHIFAGAHKIDGNPFEPLPADVRAAFQADINQLYGMFTDAVAKHLGTTAAAIRKTEAQTYRGQDAVATGLATRISTTDQMISELAALRVRSHPVGPTARSTANDKGVTMSGNSSASPTGDQGGHKPPANSAANPAAFSQADLDSARAEGRTEGAHAERTRVSAILGHEAATNRTALALQCVTSGLSAEQAGAILAASPAAPAASAKGQEPVNAFAAVMTAMGNPAVSGIEGSQQPEKPDEAVMASQILASFRGTHQLAQA